VECLFGGDVNDEDDGPGVIKGCLATCKALMTTAVELWYLLILPINFKIEN